MVGAGQILFCTLTYTLSVPAFPSHELLKAVQDGTKTVMVDGVKTKQTVKKVFVSLREGGYVYRIKRFLGKNSCGKIRAQFVCTLSERLENYTRCFTTVILQEQKDQVKK